MFSNSPKKYLRYKADCPLNTISRIENGFKRISIQLDYTDSSSPPLFSGSVRLKNSHLYANGKGSSAVLAKASAYAEFTERYSAGHFYNYLPIKDHLLGNNKFMRQIGNDRSLIENFMYCKNLRGYSRLYHHPLDDFIAGDKFFERYNISKDAFNSYLGCDLLSHWVDARSLKDNKNVKVPITLIRRICESNGLAAGNSLEEAFVQASCEIFERYSLVEIYRKRITVPTLDEKSINDKRIRGLISYFRSINVGISIKDFSLNNRIPVVGVVFKNMNIKNDKNALKKNLFFRTVRAASCMDISQAILRCFHEELQGLSIVDYIQRPRYDYYWQLLKEAGIVYRNDIINYDKLLSRYEYSGEMDFLEDENKRIDYKQLKSLKTEDFLDDITEIERICTANRWDIYFIDMTHPKLAFPTIRVIIPSVSDILFYRMDPISLDTIVDNLKWFNILTIDGVYEAITQKDWIENKDNIRHISMNMERMISQNPDNNVINLMPFGYKPISVTRLLAALYFKLGEKDRAQRFSRASQLLRLGGLETGIDMTNSRQSYETDEYFEVIQDQRIRGILESFIS